MSGFSKRSGAPPNIWSATSIQPKAIVLWRALVRARFADGVC
jgi:hypothetical protein